MFRVFEHKMDRSESSHAILDSKSRRKKAAKIVAVLSTHCDLGESTVLDVGTGSGHIAHELSKYTKKQYSVDIVDERSEKRGYRFIKSEDESLPFEDESFDVVITNHVIEHVPNQAKHTSEILRVIRPGGVVYLATPNKLWLRDPHYKLPLISWLPRFLANSYLRLIQNKEWDVYPVSPRGIKSHFSSCKVENALPLLVKGGAAKELDTMGNMAKLLRFLPGHLLNLTQYVSPTLIYIITKPK